MSGYPWDALVSAPGQDILLGSPGGRLLFTAPPPGYMSHFDMKCRVWHLLRENGPDNGFPEQTVGNGDFPNTVVTRDLNIAIAQYISDTGLAPSISERADTYPVIPVLDHPVPPTLVSLSRVEYNQVGGITWTLEPKSAQAFDEYTGFQIVNTAQGPPQYYRAPFAGYIRLQPQPGPQQANGPGQGVFTLNGIATAGQTLTASMTPAGGAAVNVTYTVQANDNPVTIMQNLGAAIMQSTAFVGGSAFLAAVVANSNTLTIVANTTPGLNVTYSIAITAGNGSVAPTHGTTFIPGPGDTMTWYYTSNGNVLTLPGDTSGLPVSFSMAPVYRVLADYWLRKQDDNKAEIYMKRYDRMVVRGKAYDSDVHKEGQKEIGGIDPTEELNFWPTRW